MSWPDGTHQTTSLYRVVVETFAGSVSSTSDHSDIDAAFDAARTAANNSGQYAHVFGQNGGFIIKFGTPASAF